jgi:hypothetical protein
MNIQHSDDKFQSLSRIVSPGKHLQSRVYEGLVVENDENVSQHENWSNNDNVF